MARFEKFEWLPTGFGGIKTYPYVATNQSIASAGTYQIQLNGRFNNGSGIINISDNGTSSNSKGTIRQLRIFIKTTTDAIISVSGSQNGKSIAETINVPGSANPTTVTSLNYFDTITAILVTVGNNANGDYFYAGLGVNGFFPLIKLNPDISPKYGGPFWCLSLMQKVGIMALEVYYTQDEIAQNGKTFVEQINNLQQIPTPTSLDAAAVATKFCNLQSNYTFPVYQDPNADPLVSIATNSLMYLNEILIKCTAADDTVITTESLLCFRQT